VDWIGVAIADVIYLAFAIITTATVSYTWHPSNPTQFGSELSKNYIAFFLVVDFFTLLWFISQFIRPD